MEFLLRKKIKWLAVLLSVVILEMILVSVVHATCGVDETCTDPGESYSFMGNPLAGDEQKSVGVAGLAGRFSGSIIAVVGSLTLIMFMYGGFLWLTAGGNEEKLGKAKKTLGWTLLGLIAIFAAYAIISFVIGNITATTLQATPAG